MRKLALLLVSTAGLVIMGSSAMAEDPAQPAPAATAAPAATPAPAAAASTADLDKVVCRNMEAATGTRLGARRECKTQRQWDDARLQTQREIGQMQSSGNLGPRGN